ncbi:MAG TPA: hypothetical protein PKM21_12570 [Anaerolineales bacterium]|nr:hypothetical protein [Anaerolineales bacterium]
MTTAIPAFLLPLICGLLIGLAALAGGGILLAQNKERGIAIAVLVAGVLCIVAILGIVLVYAIMMARTGSM